MEKEKLLKELHDAFNRTKARLKFKSSFEEIDSICFLEDFIFSQKYVSNSFSRQMINRLMDTFYSWMPNLHSWIFPQNYDAVFSNESKQFSQQEKNEIYSIMGKIMYFVRKNKRIAFEKNEKEEGQLIDELVDFEKKVFSPFMIKYNLKFEEFWSK